jgi:cytochrome c556
MRGKIALYAAALLVVGGVGQVQQARADGLDPIAIRQVGMDLAGGDFAFIQSVAKAKGEAKPLEKPAQALARWAKTIPLLFPAGTDHGGNTKALPEIWSDRAGFEKAAANMGEAAAKLAETVKAGDADAVAADAKALGEACGSCHRHYRAR